jgi:hypothetical protein
MDNVTLPTEGGEDDDGNPVVAGNRPDLPDGLETIHARHHQIHQYDIRRLTAENVHGFNAVAREQRNTVQMGKEGADDGAVGGNVIGDEHPQYLLSHRQPPTWREAGATGRSPAHVASQG